MQIAILVALICIFLAILPLGTLIKDLVNQNDRNNIELVQIKELLTISTNALSNIKETNNKITFCISDLIFDLRNIEKCELKKALTALENIDCGLMELKDIRSALSLLESSVNIISNHPAFSRHDDDLFA